MEHLSIFEAAHILGLPPADARPLLQAEGLTGPRTSKVKATNQRIEEIALRHYRWRRHTHDPDSYWVTASQAAEIVGVSIQRVKQLLDKDFLPYVTHKSGARLMRREQLEIVANARLSRRLRENL